MTVDCIACLVLGATVPSLPQRTSRVWSVSEMTYIVSSGTLNLLYSTIPYHTKSLEQSAVENHVAVVT